MSTPPSPVIWPDGTQMWYHGVNQDQLHRDGDLPAIIWGVKTREWYQFGKKHRDGDRPAYIGIGGTCAWYCHGQLHRVNGRPAIIRDDGSQEWWEYGDPVSNQLSRARRQYHALACILSAWLHPPLSENVLRFMVTTFL